MISEKSNRLYKKVLKLAYLINAIPYKIVNDTDKSVIQLEITPHLSSYKCTLAGNLMALVGMAIGLISWILIGSPGSVLTLCILTGLAIIALCLGIQVLLFFGRGNYFLIVNALQNIQADFVKIYKVTTNKDGLERILPIFNAAVSVLPFAGFPIAIFVLQTGFGSSGIRQNWSINLGSALALTMAIAINVSTVAFLFYTSALYANSLTLWMQCLKWKPGCSLRTRNANQLVFRKLQILNLVTQKFCEVGILFGYTINIILQTLLICFIVIINVKLPLVSTLGLLIVLVCLFITEFCFRKVLEMRRKSIEYPTSFLKNQPNLRKLDISFFRSCTPIEYWVGGLFSVASSSFFLEIYGLLIIETVCDLIITFKSAG